MLGKELRRVRVEVKKETLREVSRVCGLTITYLSDIERGRKVPKNGQSLKKLCLGYNVNFDSIISWLVADIKKEADSES